jgi:hypothetical protein
VTEPLNRMIEDLDLPVRAYNVLRREGVVTVRDLSRMTQGQLADMRGMRGPDLTAILTKLSELTVVLPAYVEEFHQVEESSSRTWTCGDVAVSAVSDGSAYLDLPGLTRQYLKPEVFDRLLKVFRAVEQGRRNADIEEVVP